MEVILLERVERLGMIGETVKVKPGFARNYLLPQGKALRATKENKAYFEAQRAQIEANNLKMKNEAEKVAKKIEGTVLVVLRQAGESGQLYGSVNAKDIVAILAEQKVTADWHQVKIDHPIKTLGVHEVRVALHPEVVVNIKVNVAKSEEEAEAQLKEHQELEKKGAYAVAKAEPAITVEEAPEVPEEVSEAPIESVEE